MHLKVKHINSVLEKIHDYNISAYMRGGGNHEKTFQSHMENIKSQCKDALAKVFSHSVLRLQPWANRQDA